MPSPPFASSATRYGRPQLLRLVAARRLRVGEKLELAKIKTRLNEMTAGEIEAFVVSGLGAGPLAAALGVAVATAAAPAAADPSFGTQPPLGGLQVSPDRRWTRLELAVGLELHIRDDVAAPALELARQIWRLCVQGVSPTPPAKT